MYIISFLALVSASLLAVFNARDDVDATAQLAVTISCSIVLAFWAVSLYSLWFPRHNFLVQKNEREKTIMNEQVFNLTMIAHRGGREHFPENTLASFNNAFKYAEMIELDVWLTKDGKVIVLHDGTLDRVTGVDDHVENLMFDDLPKIRKFPSDGFPQGSDNNDLEALHPVPLLEEVLDILPRKDFPVIIEFKQNSQQLVDEVYEILKVRNMHRSGNIAWFSLGYHGNTNKLLRRKDPWIPVITSVQSSFRVFFCYWIGLLPFINLENHFDVFGFIIARDMKKGEWGGCCLDTFILPLAGCLLDAPTLYRHLRLRKHPVWALGVNSQAGFRDAHRAGATGFLTDRPAWAAEMIQANDDKGFLSVVKKPPCKQIQVVVPTSTKQSVVGPEDVSTTDANMEAAEDAKVEV